MKINNIPKLESTDRLKPEDLIKFFAWKEVIQIFLDGLNLLDTVKGNIDYPEAVAKPSEEMPTHEEITFAKKLKNKDLVQHCMKTIKKWKKYNEYEAVMKKIEEKEKKAMLVLVQALGPQAVVKFKVNYTQKDTAREFWDRIINHFLQDSALIISNIQKTLGSIKMENNEKVDALADRMKNHTSHLKALGVEVKDEYLKETLIQAIQDSKQSNKYETIVLNTVGEIHYKGYDFDMTVQKLINMEGYIKEFHESNGKHDKEEKEKENPNTEMAALFTQHNSGSEGGRGRGRGRFHFGGRGGGGRGRGRSGRGSNSYQSFQDQHYQGNSNTNFNYQNNNEYNAGRNKNSNYKFPGICYRCQRYGHKAEDCYSNMATVNFAKRMKIENINEVNQLKRNDEHHDIDEHEMSL